MLLSDTGQNVTDFEGNLSASADTVKCFKGLINEANLLAISGILDQTSLEERLCRRIDSPIAVYKAELGCFKDFVSTVDTDAIKMAFEKLN